MLTYEIYTDVEGIYTSDPRVVPNARKMKEITYGEMLEMAKLGLASCKILALLKWANKCRIFLFMSVPLFLKTKVLLYRRLIPWKSNSI